MSCVVCIAFDGDQVISWVIPLFGGGPVRPYIVWGGQVYMEVLVRYKPRSPTRVLFG
jgi:hypothetical protein